MIQCPRCALRNECGKTIHPNPPIYDECGHTDGCMMFEPEPEAKMDKAEAVGISMAMMCRNNNEREIIALQIACRNLIKRWSDKRRWLARKHGGDKAAKEEAK